MERHRIERMGRFTCDDKGQLILNVAEIVIECTETRTVVRIPRYLMRAGAKFANRYVDAMLSDRWCLYHHAYIRRRIPRQRQIDNHHKEILVCFMDEQIASIIRDMVCDE